jgi:alkylation response protein AidB-like acyl-CoA dehydrogenase
MSADTLAAEEIRESARAVLARHATSHHVRALFDDADRLDLGLWAQMAELGWTGIDIGEEHGGLGLGFGSLVVLLEELGRCTAGGPFLATALAAAALEMAGTGGQRAAVLPRAASGQWFGTVALADRAGHPRAGVQLLRDGGGLRLEGTAGFVLDASVAESVVVAAQETDGGDALLLMPCERRGITIERVPVVDQTRNLGHVHFSETDVEDGDLMAEGSGATSALARLRSRAGVAVAADSVGIAREVVDRTAAYARDRVQFGLPIGAFQGVKHQCADMFVTTEAAATLVTAAAEALVAGRDDGPLLASMAKSYACGRASETAGRGVQLHGGIGYTWEHDMHIFLKRAKLNEALLGDTHVQLRSIAKAVIDQGAVDGEA